MRTTPILALLALTACNPPDRDPAILTVFAAASTADVMKTLATRYTEAGGPSIKFNLAGSGALARQIEAGAPADVFISANGAWMDYLAESKLLADGTRTVIAANTLVLIAPEDSSLTYVGFPENLKDRLAIGDPRSVPAGTYAQAALGTLGWLDQVREKIIKGANVRTVLMYVERGEVGVGIVYCTDAMQSDRVRVVGTFPPDSHPPIVYPAACLKNSSESAKAFLVFLKTDEAKAVFEQYGFIFPEHSPK